MDQSNRYADLSLKEEDLIKGDQHVLVAYHMQPATGYGYLASGRAHCRRILYRNQRGSLYHR